MVSENAKGVKATVTSRAPRNDVRTLIFRFLSPQDACRCATRQLAESNSFYSLGFGTLVWEFNHIHLLVALVYLNADAGGSWRNGRNLLHRGVMNDRLYGWGVRDPPVQTSGIGGRNLVLLGVEGIAQRELNMSFRAGECEPLGIVGRNHERADRGIRGLPGRGSFQGVARRKDCDVLENGRGLLFAAPSRCSPQKTIATSAPRPPPPPHNTTTLYHHTTH